PTGDFWQGFSFLRPPTGTQFGTRADFDTNWCQNLLSRIGDIPGRKIGLSVSSTRADSTDRPGQVTDTVTSQERATDTTDTADSPGKETQVGANRHSIALSR